MNLELRRAIRRGCRANSQRLSRRLEEMGVRVLHHSTVADALDACAAAFRHAIERAVATIRACLGDLVFGEDDDELENALGRLLERRRATLAPSHAPGVVTPWGDVFIVRYADDFVIGFQHQNEAHRFVRELAKRMEKFGLQLHPEKTRLIEFGRSATARGASRSPAGSSPRR